MSEKKKDISPMCCVMLCDAPAEFEITNTTPGASAYDYTHACESHVGELLGGDAGGPTKAWRWTVTNIAAKGSQP